MKSSEEEAPASASRPSWSFLSLPNEIVLSCLARIPPSYYPKLSLVSKSFQSLILSKDLYHARRHLQIEQKCVFLCLKLPTRHHPYWFSLYKTNNSGNLSVPIPSSYTPFEPMLYLSVLSEFYTFDASTAPSSVFFVSKSLDTQDWLETPSMKVARMSTLIMNMIDLDEKIYIMGGCDPDESTHWAEVYDVKTKTWESLPDPGPELRFSSIKIMQARTGKIYAITDKKNYVYDLEQRSWDVTEKRFYTKYKIENVLYSCNKKKCKWFDSKLEVWKEVKGLDMVSDKKNCLEIANFGGKLITFWESPNEGIWCAVITLERRQDEIWGHIESNDKLNVPNSTIFIRAEVMSL